MAVKKKKKKKKKKTDMQTEHFFNMERGELEVFAQRDERGLTPRTFYVLSDPSGVRVSQVRLTSNLDTGAKWSVSLVSLNCPLSMPGRPCDGLRASCISLFFFLFCTSHSHNATSSRGPRYRRRYRCSPM